MTSEMMSWLSDSWSSICDILLAVDLDKRNFEGPDPALSELVDDLEKLGQILMNGVSYAQDEQGEVDRNISFSPSLVKRIENLDDTLEMLVDASTSNFFENPFDVIGAKQVESLKSFFLTIAAPFVRKRLAEKEAINESLEKLRAACDGAYDSILAIAEGQMCRFRAQDELALNKFFERMYQLDQAYTLISDLLSAPRGLPTDISGMNQFQRDLQWSEIKQVALRLHKIYMSAKAIKALTKAVHSEIEVPEELDSLCRFESLFDAYCLSYKSAKELGEKPPVVPIEIIAMHQGGVNELLDVMIAEGSIAKNTAAEIWLHVESSRLEFHSRMEIEFPDFVNDPFS